MPQVTTKLSIWQSSKRIEVIIQRWYQPHKTRNILVSLQRNFDTMDSQKRFSQRHCSNYIFILDLASIDCAKTIARRDEKHLSFGIWCVLYKSFDGIYHRADSRLASSLWATSLRSNTVSHWLCANLESTLHYISQCMKGFQLLSWGAVEIRELFMWRARYLWFVQ